MWLFSVIPLLESHLMVGYHILAVIMGVRITPLQQKNQNEGPASNAL